MGLQFAHPEWLALLLLAPAAGLLFIGAGWRRRRFLRRFAQDATLPRLMEASGGGRHARRAVLMTLALAAAAFSLARPQYGVEHREVARKGVDVFIALDLSDSMLATDMEPNRMTRARELLKALISRMKGDRVGLIGFAGAAHVQCPLTLDYTLAQRLLDLMGPESAPIKGTALGEAIDVARRNFESNEMGYKVLVLLTDGEDSGSNPIEAAEAAAAEGVTICAIGLGDPSGSPIPLPQGGFKEDGEGHTVNSRVDFDTLAEIVRVTGGKAVLAQSAGFREADVIFEFIQTLEKKLLLERDRSMYLERFQYFLLPAILLLIVEALIGERAAARLSSVAPNSRAALTQSGARFGGKRNG